MISIRGLTGHSFLIYLATLLRKLICRNVVTCWIKTFVIILVFMVIWMQVIITSTVNEESESPRSIREVNGFPTEGFEPLLVKESKIQQPYVIMKRLRRMMKHNKNITTGNQLDIETEIYTKLLKIAKANHGIIPNGLVENDVVSLNSTKFIETITAKHDLEELKKINKFIIEKINSGDEINHVVNHAYNFNEKKTRKTKEVDYIKLKIEEANREQIIYNEDIFGYLNNDSLVILVQVHNRVYYLQHLIDSLAKARNIDQALLIFSHDIYDEEINDLIKTIKFCKVMQIFFPYSIETHPDTFPGNDSRDCPRDIGKKKALQIGCLNAEHPDKYGHYRESKFTQIKHHWWWKMNHIFNHLNVTSKYSGFVLFLEEDHYVAEDFIHVLRLMGRQCETKTLCEFLGLGLSTIKSGPSNQATMSLLQTNLGLAFNREVYLNSIKKCAKDFCEFDDYNWDWSLNYITNKCGKDPKFSMILMAQRVFHIGECGTHIRNANCDVEKVLADVQNKIKSLGLYPTTVEVIQTKAIKPKIMENGGWGDQRDHELCINMTRTP